MVTSLLRSLLAGPMGDRNSEVPLYFNAGIACGRVHSDE